MYTLWDFIADTHAQEPTHYMKFNASTKINRNNFFFCDTNVAALVADSFFFSAALPLPFTFSFRQFSFFFSSLFHISRWPHQQQQRCWWQKNYSFSQPDINKANEVDDGGEEAGRRRRRKMACMLMWVCVCAFFLIPFFQRYVHIITLSCKQIAYELQVELWVWSWRWARIRVCFCSATNQVSQFFLLGMFFRAALSSHTTALHIDSKRHTHMIEESEP